MSGLLTESVGLKDLWPVIRHHRRLILSAAFLGGLLGFAYGAVQVSVYTSFASVLIQPQRGGAGEIAKETGAGLELSLGTLEATSRLLRSSSFATKIIDELDLRNHAEYRSLKAVGTEEGTISLIDQAEAAISSLMGEASPANDFESETDADPLLLAVIERLIVDRQDDAFLISIGYVSSDPKLSAKVANLAAKLYVDQTFEEKIASLSEATGRFASLLEQHRQDLVDAESAVARFKQTNNLLSTARGGLFVDQELLATRSNLNEVRAELAEQLERYELLLTASDTDRQIESIADAETVKTILGLRSQKAKLLQSKAEAESNLGPKHPTMIALTAELQDLDSKIEAERDRVVKIYATNVEVTRERVQTIDQQLNELRQASAEDRQLQIRLQELEQDVLSKRERYQKSLGRFQRADQQQGAIHSDVRIVSNALVPTTTSTPSPISFALVGLTGSLSLAAFAVLLRDRFRTSFIRARDVEEMLGLPVLSAIPLKKQAWKPTDALWTSVADNSLSLFSESFGKIHTALMLSLDKDQKSSVLVTSAVPSEGKTTLSSCLAAYAAKINNKRRVLVVDLDFRRPAITQEFGAAQLGLDEYLGKNGEHSLSNTLHRTSLMNLDFLPIRTASTSSAPLLASEAMERLIKVLKDEYDLIICDAPPVLAVSDTKLAATWADACIFAVQWSSTSKNTAENALKQLIKIKAPVIGIVLTQVVMEQFVDYNYLEGGKYHRNVEKYYMS